MTLSDKLTALNTAKQNIKTALTSKGQDMSTVPFTSYGDTISNLNTTQLFDYCDCYISPTGSDSNTGTKNSPFKTVTQALSKNCKFIGLLNGTYSTLTDLYKQYGNYILIGEGNVILDGLNTQQGFSFTREHITYINLIFKNFKDYFEYCDATDVSYPPNVSYICCTFIISSSMSKFLNGYNYYGRVYFTKCDIIGTINNTQTSAPLYYFNYCYHEQNITMSASNFTETNRVYTPNFPERLV